MVLRITIEAYIENAAEDVDLATMWVEDDIKDAIQCRFSAEGVQIHDLSVCEH